MNCIEFNETMKYMNVYNPLSTVMNNEGKTEVAHHWSGLTINFSGTYYAVVKGKIPFEVAEIIYEKYPDNKYGIRVNGNNEKTKPNDWAMTDDNDNKYIKTYHIDTKEGLLIFLTEMMDYQARKLNVKELTVQKYDEILARISINILETANPVISAKEWMQNEAAQIKENSVVDEFRKKILEFDEMVNPFINKKNKFSDLDYTKVGISAYRGTKNERPNCGYLVITDLNNNKNRTFNYREPDSFSFKVSYISDDNKLVTVNHYAKKDNCKTDIGEFIHINYFDEEKNENIIDLQLDISSLMIDPTYKEKSQVTIKQIDFVYNELLKGIAHASSITIDNMTKKNVKEKDQD